MEKGFTKNGIYYEVHGSGPPLVMMRGLARSIRHWLGFHERVARDFQVVVLDHRGIGRSQRPMKRRDSIYDLASDLVEVLDTVSLQDAHILGVSLGGMVALAAGMKAAKRCRSLMVVNTSIGGMGKLRLSPHAAKTILKFLVPGSKDRAQESLVRLLTGPRVSDARVAEIVASYDEIMATEGLRLAAVTSQIGAAMRFAPGRDLATIRCPVMVTSGDTDKFVPNINSALVAQLIPQAKVRVLKDAGHEPGLDQADQFHDVIREWIRSV